MVGFLIISVRYNEFVGKHLESDTSSYALARIPIETEENTSYLYSNSVPMCMKISNTGVYPWGHGLTTYIKNKITTIFVLHV